MNTSPIPHSILTTSPSHLHNRRLQIIAPRIIRPPRRPIRDRIHGPLTTRKTNIIAKPQPRIRATLQKPPSIDTTRRLRKPTRRNRRLCPEQNPLIGRPGRYICYQVAGKERPIGVERECRGDGSGGCVAEDLRVVVAGSAGA